MDLQGWALLSAYILVTFTYQLTTAQLTSNAVTAEAEDLRLTLSELLWLIKKEKNFENVLIYTTIGQTTELKKGEPCPLWDLQGVFESPIVFTNSRILEEYRKKFSQDAVIIICDSVVYDEMAQRYSNSLFGLQRLRHISLLIRNDSNSLENTSQDYCRDSFRNDVYNALVILSDFATSRRYYSCKKYPPTKRAYQLKYLDESMTIYDNQFKDMHGDPIKTQPDQLLPRTMFYYSNGKLKLTGHVGKLINAFADKHNATLEYQYPVKIGETIFYDVLQNATRNGSLDVAASLTPSIHVENLDDMTYPYEFTSYCFMVPLPLHIPVNRIFTAIASLNVLLIIFALFIIFSLLFIYGLHRSWSTLSLANVLLNDKSFRGILAQSFTLIPNPNSNIKMTCFLLCYTSLLTNTMYQAYLQSYLTRPPLKSTMRTYADIENEGLQIIIAAREIHLFRTVLKEPLRKHGKIFNIIENYDEFQKKRSTMDIRYAYPVASVRWISFDEQQSLFERKLFYFNTDLCLMRFIYLSLPVRPALPYRDRFEDYVLWVRDTGLLDFWMKMNIYDMIKLKLVKLEDISAKEIFGGAIKCNDLYWIWILYVGGIAASALGFLWELVQWKYHMNKFETFERF